MGSFGERMQREREMRTVTLEEIAESTKIGTRMLHALEDEDFAKLPGGIFNKGFVRAYARYLGLDEEQAVSDFMTAYAEFQADAEHLPLGGSTSESISTRNGAGRAEMVSTVLASIEQSQPSQGAGFIIAAVILVVVLGAGGFFFKYYQSKKSASPSPATVSNAPKSKIEKKKMQMGAPAGQGIVSTAVSSATPAPDTSSNGITSVLAASAQPSNSGVPSPAETAYPEYSRESASVGGGANQVSAKKKLNLQIRSKEESWVKITADGQILMEGILSPTVSRQFRAAKELIVKLGNAGVVELSYNGKLVPAFAPDTKTKTLTFTADGLSSE